MKKTLLSIFLAAVIVSLSLLPAFTAQAAVTQESEPNNSFAEANLLVLGDTAAGSITETDEWDYYRVQLGAAGRMTLTVTSYMQYYTVFVFDSDGNQLWYKDANEWNATIGYRRDTYDFVLESGTYYIQINGTRFSNGGSKSTGKYEIETAFEAVETTNHEPDNSFAAATDMNLNDRHVGVIAMNDEFDTYKINLPSAGTLQLNMTSYMRYYTVFVFDIDGNELWHTDSNEWNESVGYRRDIYDLVLESGIYYIQVNGTRFSNGGSKSTGKYELETAFEAVETTNREPDNSFAAATDMDLNTRQVGVIAINDSFDTYKINLLSAGHLKLDMTSYMQYYTVLVYDIDGNEIWYTDANVWNEDVGYRRDTYDLSLESGIYYIQVNGARYKNGGNTSTGKYELTVGDSTEPGDLDQSGEVTIQDVMEACKILARQSAGTAPTGDELARGDLDGDGKVTITDVMEICKLLARKA